MHLASSWIPTVYLVPLDSLCVWSQRAAVIFDDWTHNVLLQELKFYFFYT